MGFFASICANSKESDSLVIYVDIGKECDFILTF